MGEIAAVLGPSPKAERTLNLSLLDLNLYVGQLTPQQKSSPAVQHALSVQRAISMGNYHSLFDLYLNAPNMGAYIMDHFISRERVRALIVMTKACVLYCSSLRSSRLTVASAGVLDI